jgi:hypothetical protein
MTKFLVRYSGSVGTRALEFEHEELNATRACAWMSGDLASYYPIYYTADLFGADGKHIYRASSKVVVQEGRR